METNIEDRALTGITPKLLITLFVGWSSVLISVISSYFFLSSQFKDKDKTDAIQDIRIKTVENSIDIQTLQIKDLNERLGETKARISFLEAEKTNPK